MKEDTDSSSIQPSLHRLLELFRRLHSVRAAEITGKVSHKYSQDMYLREHHQGATNNRDLDIQRLGHQR